MITKGVVFPCAREEACNEPRVKVLVSPYTGLNRAVDFG